jgi:hypothetical protein
MNCTYGTALVSDFYFKGLSFTAHNNAVQGYAEFEVEANEWLKLYVGDWSSSLYTGSANSINNISTGGRLSAGRYALDLGYVYRDFPGGQPNGVGSFAEIYGKGNYQLSDRVVLGARVTGGTNFNDGINASGVNPDLGITATEIIGTPTAYFYTGIVKIDLPLLWQFQPRLDGEIGRQYYDQTLQTQANYSNYGWYCIGLGINYAAATFDVRYWNSNSNPTSEQSVTVPVGLTDLAENKFVYSLKFDSRFLVRF